VKHDNPAHSIAWSDADDHFAPLLAEFMLIPRYHLSQSRIQHVTDMPNAISLGVLCTLHE
jgi:hypothetical protein